MLRSLGVYTAFKWFAVAVLAVAVWQGYNGNLAAIADAMWGAVQTGARVVTDIWNSIDPPNTGGKQK